MRQQKEAINVLVRPKRQVTLPRAICKQLGIEPGDSLELVLDGSNLVARPKKTIALEALQEIREAFQRSEITEEELQKTGRRVRKKLARERYATRA